MINMMSFLLHDLEITKHEIAIEMAHERKAENRLALLKKYDKYHRLSTLYREAVEAKWENWDWKKAENLGWLCENDFIMFKYEMRRL